MIDRFEPMRTSGEISSAGRPGCSVAAWLDKVVSSIRGGVVPRPRRTVRLRKGAMP